LLWLDLTTINKLLKLINGIELARLKMVFLILQWQKKEEGRHNKEEVYAQLHL